MTAENTERQAVSNPWDKLFEMLSFWTFVWGIVALVVTQAESANLDILALALGFVSFFGAIALARLRPVKKALADHRSIIVAAAAFAAGYFSYSYADRHSDEYKMRNAILQACTEIPSCITLATQKSSYAGVNVGSVLSNSPK